MSLAHPVDGKLVFVAAVFLQPFAHFISQMERIAENCKGNISLPKQRENIPKPAMQDRVTACDVEIRQSLHTAAHFHAVVHNALCLIKRHLHQFGMPL